VGIVFWIGYSISDHVHRRLGSQKDHRLMKKLWNYIPSSYGRALTPCMIGVCILVCMLCNECIADVLYVYDVQSDELLMGEKQSELKIGYGQQMMVTDLTTSFTGGWMKRLFGKVTQERSTTLVLLDEEQIRDIDWEDEKLTILPLDKLADISWVQERTALDPAVEEALAGRYQSMPPQLSVQRHPKPEEIDGYKCNRVDATLRLETRDTIRNTASVTHLKQQLWLTEQIPGYEDRQRIHQRLASRLGIGAERLGSLNFLLRHWSVPDDSKEDLLRQVEGICVKSVLHIDAEYTTGVDTPNPKTITKRLRDESTGLREVIEGELDRALFDAPNQFKTMVVQ
jgi:hypothetical protein